MAKFEARDRILDVLKQYDSGTISSTDLLKLVSMLDSRPDYWTDANVKQLTELTQSVRGGQQMDMLGLVQSLYVMTELGETTMESSKSKSS
mmetsp:Transcript_39509/g.70853  ORF Transcript_39509/g.70853 Transcript_39509/m.70853 type:complete len:91 (-) Transcript_39509:132-404(-)